MSFNKTESVRNAEKFMAAGKIKQAVSEYQQIVKRDPDDITNLNVLGDLLVKCGETQDALQNFCKVAEHYAQKGFPQKAIAVYNKIFRLKPDCVDTLAKLAELNRQKGAVAEAKVQYTKLAEVYEKNGESKKLLGALKALAAIDKQGAKHLLKIGEACKRSSMPKDSAEAFAEAGERLLAQEQIDAALDAFSKALEQDTDNVKAFQGYVRISLKRGTAANAVEKLEDILNEQPENGDIRELLAECYFEMKEISKAEEILMGLVAQEPTRYRILLTILDKHLAEGDAKAAMRILSVTADRLLSDDNPEDLLRWTNTILDLESENLEAMRLQARYYTSKGDVGSATAILERIAVLASRSVAAFAPTFPPIDAAASVVNGVEPYVGEEEGAYEYIPSPESASQAASESGITPFEPEDDVEPAPEFSPSGDSTLVSAPEISEEDRPDIFGETAREYRIEEESAEESDLDEAADKDMGLAFAPEPSQSESVETEAESEPVSQEGETPAQDYGFEILSITETSLTEGLKRARAVPSEEPNVETDAASAAEVSATDSESEVEQVDFDETLVMSEGLPSLEELEAMEFDGEIETGDASEDHSDHTEIEEVASDSSQTYSFSDPDEDAYEIEFAGAVDSPFEGLEESVSDFEPLPEKDSVFLSNAEELAPSEPDRQAVLNPAELAAEFEAAENEPERSDEDEAVATGSRDASPEMESEFESTAFAPTVSFEESENDGTEAAVEQDVPAPEACDTPDYSFAESSVPESVEGVDAHVPRDDFEIEDEAAVAFEESEDVGEIEEPTESLADYDFSEYQESSDSVVASDESVTDLHDFGAADQEYASSAFENTQEVEESVVYTFEDSPSLEAADEVSDSLEPDTPDADASIDVATEYSVESVEDSLPTLEEHAQAEEIYQFEEVSQVIAFEEASDSGEAVIEESVETPLDQEFASSMVDAPSVDTVVEIEVEAPSSDERVGDFNVSVADDFGSGYIPTYEEAIAPISLDASSSGVESEPTSLSMYPETVSPELEMDEAPAAEFGMSFATETSEQYRAFEGPEPVEEIQALAFEAVEEAQAVEEIQDFDEAAEDSAAAEDIHYVAFEYSDDYAVPSASESASEVRSFEPELPVAANGNGSYPKTEPTMPTEAPTQTPDSVTTDSFESRINELVAEMNFNFAIEQEPVEPPESETFEELVSAPEDELEQQPQNPSAEIPNIFTLATGAWTPESIDELVLRTDYCGRAFLTLACEDADIAPDYVWESDETVCWFDLSEIEIDEAVYPCFTEPEITEPATAESVSFEVSETVVEQVPQTVQAPVLIEPEQSPAIVVQPETSASDVEHLKAEGFAIIEEKSEPVPLKTAAVMSEADREKRLGHLLEGVDFFISEGFFEVASQSFQAIIEEYGYRPEFEPIRESISMFLAHAEPEPSMAPNTGVHKASLVASAPKPYDSDFAELENLGRPASEVNPLVSNLIEIDEEVVFDYDTCYDTATAYREMGLLDYAVREFENALKLSQPDDGTRRFFQCATMLGHCFMDYGKPDLAVTWFRRAQETPGIIAEEDLALLYEIANALEAHGKTVEAAKLFGHINASTGEYRDAGQRLDRLRNGA